MTAPPWLAQSEQLAMQSWRPGGRRWPTPGAMACELDPATMQTPALIAIDDALVRLENDEYDRLMIFAPPQTGKSERVAHRYPEWVLENNLDHRVAIVSFADDTARRWGSDIKLDVETYNGEDDTLDLGIRLRSDSKAAGRWQVIGRKGGVYCVGIAGSLTGRPVDRLVLDDPIKDLEQAQSPRYRDRAKRFWQAVALPRMGRYTKVVLIQTRWHEDDLAGWLRENDDTGSWHVLSIPAIAESASDPLGRAVGEPMESPRGQDWEQRRAESSEYVWSAMYQQRPAPMAGGLFKRDRAQFWSVGVEGLDRFVIGSHGAEVDLRDCLRFITLDLATSTKTSGDYTVGAAWAIAPSGDLILLDRVRDRVDKTDHWTLIAPLRARWLQPGDTVYVESAMFGTTFVYEAGRDGIPLSELEADTDKVTRAIPAAQRWDSGRVWLPPDAQWMDDWLSELAAFPNAAHDDQVDVFAYAARVAATRWLGGLEQAVPITKPRSGQLDLMTVQY